MVHPLCHCIMLRSTCNFHLGMNTWLPTISVKWSHICTPIISPNALNLLISLSINSSMKFFGDNLVLQLKWIGPKFPSAIIDNGGKIESTTNAMKKWAQVASLFSMDHTSKIMQSNKKSFLCFLGVEMENLM